LRVRPELLYNEPHCLLAGPVRAKRIKLWTFYKRDETRMKKVKEMIVERMQAGSTSVPIN
jgi:hypothetical protein